MISKFPKTFLALMMATYLSLFLTSPSIAGMVGSIASPEVQSNQMRVEEINKIQLALENELVRAKLKAYGLTSDEITQKLQGMTDGQINLLAQASDDILAGGGAIGLVIGVLLIILLVVLILKVMDKTIVVK
ncbi:MAG: PA2779 family protein [Proteobacteria bacterium]|nr:PA2779 family protein [Pseudomonadota bacterium]